MAMNQIGFLRRQWRSDILDIGVIQVVAFHAAAHVLVPLMVDSEIAGRLIEERFDVLDRAVFDRLSGTDICLLRYILCRLWIANDPHDAPDERSAFAQKDVGQLRSHFTGP